MRRDSVGENALQKGAPFRRSMMLALITYSKGSPFYNAFSSTVVSRHIVSLTMTNMEKSCSCASYKDLELPWDDITTRIRKTKKIRQSFQRIDDAEDKRDALYKCMSCGQLWQDRLAWGWDTEDDPRYLFRVPTVSVNEWIKLPFVRPHELLVFTADIERITKGTKEKNEPCQSIGCTRKAVTHSTFCLRHHIESLQTIRSVQVLSGRWFSPYDRSGFAPP